MKTDIGTNNKTNLKTGVKTYNLDELKQLFTNNRIIGPSGRLNCQREKYLTGNKDVYNIYNEYISHFRTEQEAFYCLKHNITVENIPVCPMCGALAKFIGKRYNITCENCNANALPDKIEKAKESITPDKIGKSVARARETMLKRYGAPAVNQFYNKETKEKYEKRCLLKYGVKNPASAECVKEKRRQTCIKKYGAPSNLCLGTSERSKRVWTEKHDEIVNKRKTTSLNKFGTPNTAQSATVKQKMHAAKHKRTAQFEMEHNCTRFANVIVKYGQGWKSLLREGSLHVIEDGYARYLSNIDIPIIEEYNKREHICSVSKPEIEIRDYVSRLLVDANILYNRKNIISEPGKTYELDIFAPEKNVAIEYNGVYWHSTKVVPNNYHLRKTQLCNKKGIRLIHIFEDEWKWKQEICKSVISSSFNIYKEKYYARQCVVGQISAKTYREFLTVNHISGHVNSKYKYGLFTHTGELVQVIGIGKSRFNKNELELHRMCSKLFTNVIGGFSKLLKHAAADIKNAEHIKSVDLCSYVDLSKFTGAGYEKSGFSYISTTKPSYFYVAANLKHKNRLQMQKSKLPKMLEHFDESLTEQQNAVINGYHCIYDCGTKKYKISL